MYVNASQHRLSTNRMRADCLSLKLPDLLAAAAAAVVVVLPAFTSLPPVTLRLAQGGRDRISLQFCFLSPPNPPLTPFLFIVSFIPANCRAGSPATYFSPSELPGRFPEHQIDIKNSARFSFLFFLFFQCHLLF